MSFIYRPGSVIADFVINFQQTANETVLSTAKQILNDSVTHSQNVSRLGDLQVDPSSLSVVGKKLQIILYRETQLVGNLLLQTNSL